MKYALVMLLVAAAVPAEAQTRAEQLAVEFTKKKDVTKEKRGVSVRKYHEVISTPWQLPRAQDYSGLYASEPFTLDIRVAADGTVTGSGHDHLGTFDLRDGRFSQGVISAQRAYRHGRMRPIEAVFLKRQDRSAAADPFTHYLGLGYVDDAPAGSGVSGPMRYFLTKR